MILNKRLALRHRCERHSWAVLPLQTVPIDPEQKKPGEEPAGNESNNPLGDPNDVGTAGDYSR